MRAWTIPYHSCSTRKIKKVCVAHRLCHVPSMFDDFLFPYFSFRFHACRDPAFQNSSPMEETEAPANPDMFGLGVCNSTHLSLWYTMGLWGQGFDRCWRFVCLNYTRAFGDAKICQGCWRGWGRWHGEKPVLGWYKRSHTDLAFKLMWPKDWIGRAKETNGFGPSFSKHPFSHFVRLRASWPVTPWWSPGSAKECPSRFGYSQKSIGQFGAELDCCDLLCGLCRNTVDAILLGVKCVEIV